MSRKLILASTMSMILVGTEAYALGVGALHTQSALNQPFAGQIELTDVKPDELDAVKVSTASPEAYAKAGLERYYYLTKLQFTPEVSPQGKTLVRVSSREPIREPFMDLLVEVVWPQGQLIKEYTVLMDPPASARRRASGIEPPVVARRGASSSNDLSAPGEGFPLAVGPVSSGTGLWALARAHRPSGASVAQTAMALYRNNQHAFVRGNIHRLIAGATLVVPTRGEFFALDSGDADREYAAAVRGRPVRRSPITDVAYETDSARLRIAGPRPGPDAMAGGGQVAAPSASSAGSVGPSRVAGSGMEKDVLLALETSESTRQETQILRDRIKELETHLADIQNVLQVRNAELARIQSSAPIPGALADAQPVTAEMRPVAPVAPPAEPSVAPDTVPAPVTAETPPTEAAPAASGEPSPTAESGPTPPAEAVSPGLVPLPEPTVAPAPMPGAPPQPPVAPKPAAPTASQPESSSTWDSLLLPLAGFAGLTAVGILLFSWLTARRRQREEAEKFVDTDSLELDGPAEPSTVPHVDDKAELLPDAPEPPAAVKRSSEPELNTTSNSKAEADGLASPVSMMSSLSNFDAETDEADVLSEADIYLAYGRHSEAQELLRNELKRSPNRLDVKFKLADAYAGAKNLDAMAALMREIEAAGGSRFDPGQWRRLQDLHEQIQSVPDSAPVSGAREGGAAAAPLRQPKTSSLTDNLLVDSMGLGVDDVFSLDLSEDQGSSVGETAQSMNGRDRAVVLDKPGSSADLVLDLSEETVDDDEFRVPVGFPDIDSGHDSYGEALTVRSPTRDESSPFKSPLDDLVDYSKAADSELILALEEQKVDVVDDLDSIFDTSSPEDLTLVRDEMIAGRPSGANQLGFQIPDSLPDSLQPPIDESVPTDLLSSQWQMDSGIWDEAATKLDLARAYIEMDDVDAAREILQEVMAEGRDEQRDEARSLLEKMA